MKHNKIWIAPERSSSVAGDKSHKPSARVWVRHEPSDAPPTTRPPSQISSAARRPGVGLGLACTAAVLAAAAAKPSSPPAAVCPESRLVEGVFLVSPHKLVRAANVDAQAEPARVQTSPTAPAAAVSVTASRPQPVAQGNHAGAGSRAVSSKRLASKSWVRSEAAQPLPPGLAVSSATTAAASTGVLQGSHFSPMASRHTTAERVPRTVSGKQQPVSKTWVRLPPSRPQAVQRAPPAPAPSTAVHRSRVKALLHKPRRPANKVWTRDGCPDQHSQVPPSQCADTLSARGDSPERCSANIAGTAPPAIEQAVHTLLQPLPVPSKAVQATSRPRSLILRNPVLGPADSGTAAMPAGPVTAKQMAAAEGASVAVPRSSSKRMQSGAAAPVAGSPRGRSVRSAAGARASALGRVVHGGVAKPAKPRSNKLQRIGEHLYRAKSGHGGRTLQRQGATPTYSARPVKRMIRASRLASGRATQAAQGRSSAAVAPVAKRSGAGARSGTAAEPTVFCPSFCRTGKCRRRTEGRCKYVHDASKVAVCPGWLLGHCKDAACSLQHAHAPALMPVCTFFLQGLCSNTQCPYLHMNLDASAPVCEAFLRGYCAAGAACRSKHLTRRMVKDLRAKRTLVAGVAGDRAVKKPKVSRPQRYFTDAGAANRTEAVAITADAQKEAHENGYPVNSRGDTGPDSDDNIPAASAMAARLASPWPEFIHLPEDTDSE